MTVIRSSFSLHNVLDFSGRHYSKSKIRKTLKELEFRIVDDDGNQSIFERRWIINQIKVGMYVIQIITNPKEGSLKIKDLDTLHINIYEEKGKLPINLEQDGRFKQQYWIQDNILYALKSKNLVDIIYHCQRLDGLKAFL